MDTFTMEGEAITIIREWMKKNQPKVVVELGSGKSTDKFAMLCEELWSYEGNKEYITKHRKNVKLIYAPIVHGWYQIEKFPEEIDLLIVDGPEGRIGELAKLPAVYFFKKYLKGAVFLHDCQRKEELKIAKMWGEELKREPVFYKTKYGLCRI